MDYLNTTYDLNIQVEQGASSDDVMNELNDLEEKLQMFEQISEQPQNINIELTPSPLPSSSFSAKALAAATTYNVGYYSYSWDRYVDAEIDTLKYTKKVTFNYEYYTSNGHNTFHSISNVSSDVSSIDDLLMGAGLKGWVHDGYDATFSNSNRTVTVNIYGHYQLGLNYDFISIGVQVPFSSETWTLTITLN